MRPGRWAALAAKVAVPVLAVGVVATALIVPAAVASQPGPARTRTPQAVPVDAVDLVCPGPETIGVRGADPAQAPAPSQVFAAVPPSSLLPEPGRGSSSGSLTITAGTKQLATTQLGADAGTSLAAGQTAPASPVVQARGAAAPGVIADQLTAVPQGDLRGLSTAPCTVPADDVWLVGGGSEQGRRGRLVLSNPHDATTEVSVDVLGADGPVARTPGSTVALAPHARTVLLLDALAPGVTSPVVHVRSSGGSVAAVLNDSWLDGLTALGSDDVVAALPPAEKVVVPGVRLGLGAVLRIAVPGAAEAVAQVHLIGEKGAVDLGDAGVVRVAGGSSHDIDLSKVPSGAYAIQVDADEPVLAGAMVHSSLSPAGGDLVWSASSDAVTSLTGIAHAVSAPGWTVDVVLSAPDKAASLDVVTVQADGSAVSTPVDVTAGTTRVVPVAGTSVWLKAKAGSGPWYAARSTIVRMPGIELVSSAPLRQLAPLTRVPADVAAAAD
ncbi:DUF5719 family protein [Angustibacter luteus]|uniref:DUF5719 family protein n=1 Tax=Angustibacter luteus TaxID=658456 RepID=A0ABW1JFT7_9ACTN